MLKIIIALVIIELAAGLRRATEEERVQDWFDSNNTWPPRWQDESPAFREAMQRRETELMLLPGAEERWQNFMQYTQSRLVPRFTERGFEVIETPPHVHEKLKAVLERGIARWNSLGNEPQIDAVYTPLPSKFIHLGRMQTEIADDLKALHEAWSGMELEPTSTYGIRAYQNGSSLIMHHDKVHTHVISSIVHIGHEYYDDDRPWPIEIEDHNGHRHAVNLEAGQMLFYESAACLHGRRQIFYGKYYASVFVHYQPVDRSIWNYETDDVIAAVPPFWREGVLEDHGSRFAGQGLTIDSCVTDGAPPRIINGEQVDDIVEFYNRIMPGHAGKLRRIEARPGSTYEEGEDERNEL